MPKGKNENELGEKIIKEFAGLRAKTYDYLKDNNDEDKKNPKYLKKCVIKRKLRFQDYKNYLEAAQTENKVNHLEQNKFDIDSLTEKKKKKKLQKIVNQY